MSVRRVCTYLKCYVLLTFITELVSFMTCDQILDDFAKIVNNSKQNVYKNFADIKGIGQF